VLDLFYVYYFTIAEGPRDALSVEILSTATQLYEKSHAPASGTWAWRSYPTQNCQYV